jgi:MFS family permease
MKWVTVALLCGVALLNYLDRQVVFSLFPLLQRDLHASTFELGLISTVFLWTYGALSPFGGYIADRLGRVPVILTSLVVWTIATWVTAHVATMHGMLWSRAMMGASEAFYLPAALALIADQHTASTRSLATGIHQSGLYTGLILGGVWGGWMGDHQGWRPVFQILGVVGAAYSVVIAVALLRKEKATALRAGFFGSLNRLLHSRGFLLLTVAFTAMALVNWIVYTWLPVFLFERFHLSLAGAGFSATFYIQAASYTGAVLGGLATDRWAARMPRARIYSQAAGMMVAAPFLVLLSVAESQPLLIAALVTFGLGRGLFDCNTMPNLLDTASAELSATGYGVFNLAGCVIGGAGAAVAGSMKAHLGLSAAFQLAAVVLLAGGLTLLRMPKTRALVR